MQAARPKSRAGSWSFRGRRPFLCLSRCCWSPGLKFKLPFIQHVTKVSKTIQGFPLGYRIGSNASVDEESLMITYDYNFVNVDFYVEYRVTDPIKYLYSSQDPVGILKMLCQSYIRDTIGLYNVDSVITTGKSEIQSTIKEKVIQRLETEDIGLQLTNIRIQDAEPPTAEVQRAFTAVETAKQSADTTVNNAKKYANEVIPAAAADADQIIKKAEAYRTCSRSMRSTRSLPSSAFSMKPWNPSCPR